jgi:hypothetical protein
MMSGPLDIQRCIMGVLIVQRRNAVNRSRTSTLSGMITGVGES